MSYFQNPFAEDYIGHLVIADIEKTQTYKCPRNGGRTKDKVVAWNAEPFDLSGNDADGNVKDELHIAFTIDDKRDNWNIISVELTDSEAATRFELADLLNSDSTFSTFFVASAASGKLIISANPRFEHLRFYIVNGHAEESLGFNARAGVAELPTYFDRHKVSHFLSSEEKIRWTENANILIPLDPDGSDVDAAIIDNAADFSGNSLGYDSTNVKADYELLKGESGYFNFQKITVDGDDRITEIIEYPAGAASGNLAKKIKYVYTETNKSPDQITEEPHTLGDGDLVTP
jgi:hypothetical protein